MYFRVIYNTGIVKIYNIIAYSITSILYSILYHWAPTFRSYVTKQILQILFKENTFVWIVKVYYPCSDHFNDTHYPSVAQHVSQTASKRPIWFSKAAQKKTLPVFLKYFRECLGQASISHYHRNCGSSMSIAVG